MLVCRVAFMSRPSLKVPEKMKQKVCRLTWLLSLLIHSGMHTHISRSLWYGTCVDGRVRMNET